MVYAGVMALNELIYEALWEGDFFTYGETDAVADCQWHPLEAIVKDYKKKKLSRTAARKLFQKALSQTDMEQIDYLTLEDALEDSSNKRLVGAKVLISEVIDSWGYEERWTIFSDVPVGGEGTSYNPFDYVKEGEPGEEKIVVVEGLVYFIETDNIVEGYSKGDHVLSDGKVLPTYEVSMLPKDPENQDLSGPTYGPPKRIMEAIKQEIERRMASDGLSFPEVLEEAGL